MRNRPRAGVRSGAFLRTDPPPGEVRESSRTATQKLTDPEVEEYQTTVRRDLVFFVNGVPNHLLIHDTNYFSAPVASEIIAELAKLGGDTAHWLQKSRHHFHAFGFRNEQDKEQDAIIDAYEKLSGILDGYSFITEEVAPEIWPMVLVREADQANASIKFFVLSGWMRRKSNDGLAEKSWDERNRRLLAKLMPFFDLASKDMAPSDTELANQLRLSAKMFRHGSMAQAYGICFLSKFTALEGLVCGTKQHGHGKLLRDRLSVLFRHRKQPASEVNELWNMRCEASHQGNAFSGQFSARIEQLESFVLGTMVFAVDHLNAAKTVDELWDNYAAAYVLPAEVAGRPPEICRYPMLHCIVDRKLQWTNAGLLCDHIFNTRKLG